MKTSIARYNELIENPSSRCACMLVLDCSGSMTGEPISELNAGIRGLLKELKDDDFAANAVDLGVIRFGGDVELMREFGTVNSTKFEDLEADGQTPMGEAVKLGIEKIEERKYEYKKTGVSYYRPWFILMSDGVPTDSYRSQAEALRLMADEKRAVVFVIGIGDGCDMNILNEFTSGRPAVRLKDVNFKEFFVWLSASLKQVSSSVPGTQVTLPSTGEWIVDI